MNIVILMTNTQLKRNRTVSLTEKSLLYLLGRQDRVQQTTGLLVPFSQILNLVIGEHMIHEQQQQKENHE